MQGRCAQAGELKLAATAMTTNTMMKLARFMILLV